MLTGPNRENQLVYTANLQEQAFKFIARSVCVNNYFLVQALKIIAQIVNEKCLQTADKKYKEYTSNERNFVTARSHRLCCNSWPVSAGNIYNLQVPVAGATYACRGSLRALMWSCTHK